MAAPSAALCKAVDPFQPGLLISAPLVIVMVMVMIDEKKSDNDDDHDRIKVDNENSTFARVG